MTAAYSAAMTAVRLVLLSVEWMAVWWAEQKELKLVERLDQLTVDKMVDSVVVCLAVGMVDCSVFYWVYWKVGWMDNTQAALTVSNWAHHLVAKKAL